MSKTFEEWWKSYAADTPIHPGYRKCWDHQQEHINTLLDSLNHALTAANNTIEMFNERNGQIYSLEKRLEIATEALEDIQSTGKSNVWINYVHDVTNKALDQIKEQG